MKKAKVKGGTIGAAPRVVRTRVSILDGSGTKDVYLAKYTIYNLPPADVQQAIKNLLDKMQADWERTSGKAAG